MYLNKKRRGFGKKICKNCNKRSIPVSYSHMKNIYLILSTLFGIFVLNSAIAQTPDAKISGTITDAGKHPIDGATIILLTARDSAGVKTELANPDGSFTFLNLKDDTYI